MLHCGVAVLVVDVTMFLVSYLTHTLRVKSLPSARPLEFLGKNPFSDPRFQNPSSAPRFLLEWFLNYPKWL